MTAKRWLTRTLLVHRLGIGGSSDVALRCGLAGTEITMRSLYGGLGVVSLTSSPARSASAFASASRSPVAEWSRWRSVGLSVASSCGLSASVCISVPPERVAQGRQRWARAAPLPPERSRPMQVAPRRENARECRSVAFPRSPDGDRSDAWSRLRCAPRSSVTSGRAVTRAADWPAGIRRHRRGSAAERRRCAVPAKCGLSPPWTTSEAQSCALQRCRYGVPSTGTSGTVNDRSLFQGPGERFGPGATALDGPGPRRRAPPHHQPRVAPPTTVGQQGRRDASAAM
jgi:hypothetical protein